LLNGLLSRLQANVLPAFVDVKAKVALELFDVAGGFDVIAVSTTEVSPDKYVMEMRVSAGVSVESPVAS
jgi:hypothetical protein